MRVRTTRRSVSRRVYASIDAETARNREAQAVKAKGYYTPPPAAHADERNPVEMARAANAALKGQIIA